MNLYDEKELKKEDKRTKQLRTIVLVGIVVIVLIMILLIFAIFYLINNPSEFTVNIDGTESAELEEILQISENEETGELEIIAPIKDVATYFGYKAFNGDYTTVSEDTSSCYVENDKEVAIFSVDSNIVYKLDLTASNAEYEYCEITNNVYMENEKLYTDISGLEKAFNILIAYDEKTKVIDIYSLDQLVTIATTRATTKYGYSEVDSTFSNQKAILDDMIVAISEDGLYGVINFSTGEEILGAQYDLIVYIPQKAAFFVNKNSKFGIIATDGTTKIAINYDSLTLIDNEKELYLAQNNGLYGVVNIEGETIIYLEYNKIGIDISSFEQNNLKTGYILLDKLIPVMQNEKWGFFDKEGNQVTKLEYDSIGCITSNTKSMAYSVLTISDKNVIVVKKDEKYTLIDLTGKELYNAVFDDVYMQVSSGEEKYYVTGNGVDYDIIERLEEDYDL